MEQPPLRVNLAARVDENSTLGERLKAVIGCSGSPSLLKVIVLRLQAAEGAPRVPQAADTAG
jgi:hypothetical protein